MEKILITGCAGFIGFHLAKHFLESGAKVIGIDNQSRRGSKINLQALQVDVRRNFQYYKEDIRNFSGIEEIFKKNGPFDLIIHEAAQVAVTTSIINPREDFEINALGTLNLLEASKALFPRSFF